MAYIIKRTYHRIKGFKMNKVLYITKPLKDGIEEEGDFKDAYVFNDKQTFYKMHYKSKDYAGENFMYGDYKYTQEIVKVDDSELIKDNLVIRNGDDYKKLLRKRWRDLNMTLEFYEQVTYQQWLESIIVEQLKKEDN